MWRRCRRTPRSYLLTARGKPPPARRRPPAPAPRFARRCSVCNRNADADARFCAACGAKLGEIAAVSGILAAADAVPAGASVLAERKHVTIMFADVVGSLAAIRDVDPEEAHDLLAPTLERMSDAVHTYGGFVTQRLGDGIMAVFGAPMAQEDHAARACHAAQHLLRHLEEQQGGFRVRVGMHSGWVAVGSSSDDFTIVYNVTGVVVGTAARVQAAAPQGCAAITSGTRDLLGETVGTRPLGTHELKGLAEPVELFALVSAGPRPPERLPAVGHSAAFVGRHAPLQILNGAFRAAQMSQGRVVLVVGEAGLGKTALVSQFAARCAGDARVVRSFADRYNAATPFHPVRDLLLGLFSLASLNRAARCAWIAGRGDGTDAAALHVQAPLHELLETGGAVPDWEGLDPPARFRLVAACVRDLLAAEGMERPVVAVVEDLQRADSATVDLLGVLAETVRDSRVLILATSRPEREPTWAGRDSVMRLGLEAMSSLEMVILAQGLLGAPLPPWLRHQLLAWSEGNPLFLKESVRALLDARLISTVDGSLVVDDAVSHIEPPASVAAIVAERVDQLPTGTKDVLLAASVLGGHFPLDLLAGVAAAPAVALRAHIAQLCNAGFVRKASRGEFAFVHSLFQEVCYATLLRRRRQSLHAAAFMALGGSEAQSVTLERLAHHAFRGGLWEEALRFCRLAAARAAGRASNREAAQQLEEAIEALSSLDPERRRLADAVDLRLELRAALIPLLRLDKVGQLLEEAHTLAHRIGDRRRLAAVTGLRASHAYLMQGPQACVSLCAEALKLAPGRADAALRIAPNIFLGQALYAFGRFRQAVAVFKRNRRLVGHTAPPSRMGLPAHPRIMCDYWISISLAELGDFATAERAARSMLAGQADAQPFERAYAELALGFVLMVKGDFAPALKASGLALDIADESDIPYMVPSVASQVGLLLALTGDAAGGVAAARRGVEATERIGVRSGRSRWIARLAEACLIAGDLDEAGRLAAEALQIAADAGERAYCAAGMRLRARVLMAGRRELARARTDLLEACAIARALDARPFLAKCLLDLGRAEAAAGRPGRARMRAAQAVQSFEALGMVDWAAAARTDLAQSGDAAEAGRPLGGSLNLAGTHFGQQPCGAE